MAVSTECPRAHARISFATLFCNRKASSSSILEFGHRRQSRRRDGKHSGYTETRPVQVTDARPFLIPPPLVGWVAGWAGGCLSKRNFLRTAVRYPHPGALRRPSPQGLRHLAI